MLDSDMIYENISLLFDPLVFGTELWPMLQRKLD